MNFKFQFFTVLSCFMVGSSVYGQTNSISGVVKDASGAGVEYVSVTLKQLPDSIKMSVEVSDSLGQFTFSNIPEGKYMLSAYLFGYKENSSELVELMGGADKQVALILAEDYLEGEEIVINTQRPLIRQQEDKLIVDVESMISASGLTAVDVLRRSPGVTVDKDGLIQIRGKSGVLVMIDDNPLYMTAEQIGNLLKSIPSDQVKEIEIISSPSAKYDAAGNAGVINIRLKEGAYEGLNGDITASIGYGVYHKSSAGTNSSYKKKKISLNAGYQYNNKIEMEESSLVRNFNNPSEKISTLNSYAYYRKPRNVHSINVSGNYKLTDKTKLDVNLNNIYGNYFWHGSSTSHSFKKDHSLESTYLGGNIGLVKERVLNSSLGIKHDLDSSGTSLSANVTCNVFGLRWKRDIDIQYYDSANVNNGAPFIMSMKQKDKNLNYSTKIDYTGFIKKKLKMEAGLKWNEVRSNRAADILITENMVSADASNYFSYNENISAGYLMLQRSIGKWSIQGGLRLENTITEGAQSITDSSFTRKYTDLFPSATLNFKPSEKTSYTLSYSRRIKRPEPYQLNPLVVLSDPYTGWSGNPYLLPEYTNTVEFAYSVLSGTIITTLNYTLIDQPILWMLVMRPGSMRAIGGYRNLGEQENIGISIAVNKPLTQWWTTSNNLNVYRNKYSGNMGFGEKVNSRGSWTLNSTQTIKLPKQFSLEVSGVYEAKSGYVFGTGLPMWQLNAGLQKKLWSNKASLKLAFSDIFWTYQWKENSTLGDTHVQQNYKWENRIVMLTLNYKLGKRLMTL